MSAKEVGPFLLDDLLRGVMNKNDDVWLVHWRLAGIPDLHNVAMLDLIRPHTANRIPVPIHRLTADPMLPLPQPLSRKGHPNRPGAMAFRSVAGFSTFIRLCSRHHDLRQQLRGGYEPPSPAARPDLGAPCLRAVQDRLFVEGEEIVAAGFDRLEDVLGVVVLEDLL